MHGRKPVLWEAIHALVGGELSGSSNYDTFIYHDGQTPPTKEEANTKLAELISDWDAQEYARTRKPLYPDIGDQLDDLYKEGVFSASMASKLKKLKDDNPKG